MTRREQVTEKEYLERGYTPSEIKYDKKRKELELLKGLAYIKEVRGYQLPPVEPPKNWKTESENRPWYFGLFKYKIEKKKKRESQRVYTDAWWNELERILYKNSVITKKRSQDLIAEEENGLDHSIERQEIEYESDEEND